MKWIEYRGNQSKVSVGTKVRGKSRGRIVKEGNRIGEVYEGKVLKK
jgi:hypothetical protein